MYYLDDPDPPFPKEADLPDWAAAAAALERLWEWAKRQLARLERNGQPEPPLKSDDANIPAASVARKEPTRGHQGQRPEIRECPGRLQIDLESASATLDGTTHSDVDLDALRILKALWEAKGRWIAGPELNKLPGVDGSRLDRLIKKLPQPLKALIHSAAGKGYRCPASEEVA
jgi:hypothetical protein